MAAVLTNDALAVRGLLGVWLAGGALASLPTPARGMDAAEYFGHLRTICQQLDPVAVLVDGQILGAIPEALQAGFRFHSWDSVIDSGRISPEPPDDHEVAFIQYSSGSTGAPKGCMLTPRAIAAQIDILTSMIAARPSHEVVATWTPLSHDMGLFGSLLLTLTNDMEYFMSTPQRFIGAPASWFADIAQCGATASAGTSTSLYLAARATARSTAIAHDGLTTLRNCIIGAERVDWQTVAYAQASLGKLGLRPEAMMPAYGLAEATLAVSAVPCTERPRRLALDAAALAAGEFKEAAPDDPEASSIVSAGPPCSGVTLPTMTEDTVSEVTVRTPSLARGYWADPVATQQKFRDGSVRSGDLGIVHQGELYPIGRVDDVISIAGRKVHAQEVEQAVERLDGLRPGCSTLIASGTGRTQRMSLLIEPRTAVDDYKDLADAAAATAMAKAAIPVDECVILERGSLPKTPSGKVQRHRCRSLYEAGKLVPLAIIRFP
ncbi:fatty-acyl-CoA synthase [Mycobacterium sp. MAA66]